METEIHIHEKNHFWAAYIPHDWSPFDQTMDEDEFKSQTFQRVYQYLSRLAANRDFDDVDPLNPEGTSLHCLNILLR